MSDKKVYGHSLTELYEWIDAIDDKQANNGVKIKELEQKLSNFLKNYRNAISPFIERIEALELRFTNTPSLFNMENKVKDVQGEISEFKAIEKITLNTIEVISKDYKTVIEVLQETWTKFLNDILRLNCIKGTTSKERIYNKNLLLERLTERLSCKDQKLEGESSAVTIEGLGNSKRKIPHESSADSKPLMVKMDEDTVFDLREPIPTDSKPSEKLDIYVKEMREKERTYEEAMEPHTEYTDFLFKLGKMKEPVLVEKKDLKKLFDKLRVFILFGENKEFDDLENKYLSEEE